MRHSEEAVRQRPFAHAAALLALGSKAVSGAIDSNGKSLKVNEIMNLIPCFYREIIGLAT